MAISVAAGTLFYRLNRLRPFTYAAPAHPSRDSATPHTPPHPHTPQAHTPRADLI